MSENSKKSGILTAAVAVPVMAVCCGGGAFVAAAIGSTIGGIATWFSGIGGVTTVVVGLAVALLAHGFLRRRSKTCEK